MGSGLTLWFSMFHAVLLCKKFIIQHLELVVNCLVAPGGNDPPTAGYQPTVIPFN